ncbi:unnamed protein product [Lymnaea stagnalis]|uniref:Cyclin-dependent kinase inhibitor domain-containing protein n=1 Tax=Lymnaea stagnalis TaxID=6523 RepID=A0AAV2HCI2_LYMST
MSVKLAKLIMFNFDENVKRTSNVKRNLFGTPKKDTLNEVLGNQEKSFNETDRFRDRWGFDPSTGRPVNGSKYEWEAIKSSEVPSYYTKPYAQKAEKRGYDGSRRLDTRQQRSGTSRPLGSPKRKLDLYINDENHQVLEEDQVDRVSCKDQMDDTAKSGDSSSSSVLISDRLCPSNCVSDSPPFGLIPRSSSSSSLPELESVPTSHDILAKEYSTPTSASPKRLNQSAITDFLPLKKKRCLSFKSSGH